MSSIQLSAHGVVKIEARPASMEESAWIEFVIKTDDDELQINAFFRGAHKALVREYAEAIAAVNARYSEIVPAPTDEDDAEAA